MTENDAPESTTRARIGLSIITSSWLPVILAVDGRFPVHAASPSLKVALLAFPLLTAWRLTDRRYGDGICTTYWGSAFLVTWRKRRKRLVDVAFFFSANVAEFRRRFRDVKDSLSLSAVAHYISRRPQGNKQSVVSRSPHICFSCSGG
ncbi:hypothetical protein TNCV_2132431, partial [Trichonephila clavipes]